MSEGRLACECGRPLSFVKNVPFQVYGTEEQLVVPPASDIYECPEHGFWRVFVSGTRQRVTLRDLARLRVVILRPGDYILVNRGNDQAHVDRITSDGRRIRVRSGVLPFSAAHDVVQVGASKHGGRMLACPLSSPDDVELLETDDRVVLHEATDPVAPASTVQDSETTQPRRAPRVR